MFVRNIGFDGVEFECGFFSRLSFSVWFFCFLGVIDRIFGCGLLGRASIDLWSTEVLIGVFRRSFVSGLRLVV